GGLVERRGQPLELAQRLPLGLPDGLAGRLDRDRSGGLAGHFRAPPFLRLTARVCGCFGFAVGAGFGFGCSLRAPFPSPSGGGFFVAVFVPTAAVPSFVRGTSRRVTRP